MNESVRREVQRLLGRLPRPQRVVEFGSRDVNGTVRDLLPLEAEYIGVDLEPGENVDVVGNAAGYSPPWHPDLVLCLDMLEHTPYQQAVLANAWRILALGGALIANAPTPAWRVHSADGGELHKGEFYQAMTEEELRHNVRMFAQISTDTVEKLVYVLAVKHGADTASYRRLNVGAGEYPLPGWANLDMSDAHNVEIVADALTYLRDCEAGRWDDIYAGHFLEHLPQDEALEFIGECYRVLTPGGRLGILVPDIREVMRRYVLGTPDAVEYPAGVWRSIGDLDTLNSLFLYSTAQDSPHRWMWDQKTLGDAMNKAGFVALREIDRFRDPRLGNGQWYQFGAQGWKPKEDK